MQDVIRQLLPLAVLGGAACGLVGQTKYLEVPKWDQAPGSWEAPDFLLAPRVGEMPTHVQYLYAATDLGVAAAHLNGAVFRQQTGIQDMTACQITMTMKLSHAQIAPSEVTPYFAQNVGADLTTVFDGKVSWPALRATDPPAFVGSVPFQKQFLFIVTKGKSLVVDVRSHSSTLAIGQGWHAAMAVRDRGGSRFNFLPGGRCWRSSVRNPQNLFLGGSYDKTWLLLPSHVICLASLGTAGAGAKWGGLTLPIWLGGNCWWAAASVVYWPFYSDGSGNGVVPPIPIPNNQAFKGLRLYDQDACLTPGLNALGFITLASIEWVIGSGDTPAGATVYVLGDVSQSPIGGVWKEQVTIVRFLVP